MRSSDEVGESREEGREERGKETAATAIYTLF
jgi:hypothetical protein